MVCWLTADCMCLVWHAPPCDVNNDKPPQWHLSPPMNCNSNKEPVSCCRGKSTQDQLQHTSLWGSTSKLSLPATNQIFLICERISSQLPQPLTNVHNCEAWKEQLHQSFCALTFLSWLTRHAMTVEVVLWQCLFVI